MLCQTSNLCRQSKLYRSCNRYGQMLLHGYQTTGCAKNRQSGDMRWAELLTLLDVQSLACSTPAQRSTAKHGGRLPVLVATALGTHICYLRPPVHPLACPRPPVHLHPKHLTPSVHLHPSADLQPPVHPMRLSVHLLQSRPACGVPLYIGGQAQACPT